MRQLRPTRRMVVPGLLVILLTLFSVNVFAGEKTEQFPLPLEVAKVWEWPQVNEVFPPGKPYNFFVVRYHRAPVGLEKFGSYGLSAYLRDVPELGVLLIAWNIKKTESGTFDIGSATFAHKLENDWYQADPGLIIRAAPGFQKVDSVVVYVVYRRSVGSNPKISGREKVVAEYRFNFSTKTLVSVIFKIMDPYDQSREVYRFELDLNKTPVGEKIIRKEERE